MFLVFIFTNFAFAFAARLHRFDFVWFFFVSVSFSSIEIIAIWRTRYCFDIFDCAFLKIDMETAATEQIVFRSQFIPTSKRFCQS